jgi:hypothetical protein
LANIIGNKIYDTGCVVTSGIWWFTKESTIQTVKLVIPAIVTLIISKKVGMPEFNINMKVKSSYNNSGGVK